MQDLAKIRSGKPGSYPDQTVYAEYACAEFGLTFEDIDGGTGLAFSVASKAKRIHFGAGRCSWYPQNNATATTLASDKYFTNIILERAGIATLGGDYFFLHERHRARRPSGHEIEDALKYFARLGATAFVKPLLGSRGDFAQAVYDEATLQSYILSVSRYYDSILMQPLVSRRRIPHLPVGRRCTVCGAQISACCAGRWRAFDPRSPARAQCRAAGARTFAGCEPSR